MIVMHLWNKQKKSYNYYYWTEKLQVFKNKLQIEITYQKFIHFGDNLIIAFKKNTHTQYSPNILFTENL